MRPSKLLSNESIAFIKGARKYLRVSMAAICDVYLVPYYSANSSVKNSPHVEPMSFPEVIRKVVKDQKLWERVQ